MTRILLPVVLLAFVAGSGCTQPADMGPVTPTYHAPDGVIVEDAAGGIDAEALESGWYVFLGNWSNLLPSRNAFLELSIDVLGAWHGDSQPDPWEGSEWMFRLHLETGAVESDADRDWYRAYTLDGVPNATVSHATSFQLGDITPESIQFGGDSGEAFILRLTYHKVYDSGFWEAYECQLLYWKDGDRYVLEGGTGDCRLICSPSANGICPWSGEYGNASPPPPADW